jgi:hypothetical protein
VCDTRCASHCVCRVATGVTQPPIPTPHATRDTHTRRDATRHNLYPRDISPRHAARFPRHPHRCLFVMSRVMCHASRGGHAGSPPHITAREDTERTHALIRRDTTCVSCDPETPTRDTMPRHLFPSGPGRRGPLYSIYNTYRAPWPYILYIIYMGRRGPIYYIRPCSSRARGAVAHRRSRGHAAAASDGPAPRVV